MNQETRFTILATLDNGGKACLGQTLQLIKNGLRVKMRAYPSGAQFCLLMAWQNKLECFNCKVYLAIVLFTGGELGRFLALHENI